MSTFNDRWPQSNEATRKPSLNHHMHSAKSSLSGFFDEFSKLPKKSNLDQRDSSQTKLPLPGDNFDPFMDSYNDVDDILTQTLNSLQDLDIPIGNENNHQYQPSFRKGHSKKLSGSAIFGFVQHDNTLSISGVSIAPNQVYNEKPTQSTADSQNQPIMFESVKDLEQKVKEQQKPSDYIITGEEPDNYKFPSKSPSPRQGRNNGSNNGKRTVEVPVEYLQKLKSMIKNADNLEIDSFLKEHDEASSKNGCHESSSSSKSRVREPDFDVKSANSTQRASSIPCSASNKESSQGDALGLGLKYDSDPFFQPYDHGLSPSMLQPSLPQQQQQQPRVYQVPFYGQPNNFVVQQYPVMRTQQMPQYHIPPPPILQPPPQNMPHYQVPPVHPTQFLPHQHFQNNQSPSHIPQQIDSSESEFSDIPKTPSPTLKSQAQFDSANSTINTLPPRKKELSWTPVSNEKSIRTMSEGRKGSNKVSTLPPGEIDLYIIGPREDKTFVCNYENCGKLFTRRYNARSHVQTHLSDRPYICDHEGCHKSFVRQHDLTRHKKVHTEFAYKCHCGKRFSRHDALFKHRHRQICSGGFSEDEMQAHGMLSCPPSGSITKPERTNGIIRIENDKVAKRLQFDLVKKRQVRDEKKVKQEKHTEVRKEDGDDSYELRFNDEFDFQRL